MLKFQHVKASKVCKQTFENEYVLSNKPWRLKYGICISVNKSA